MRGLPTGPTLVRRQIQNTVPVFALAVATLWLLQISVFSAIIATLALSVIMQTGRALAAKSGLGHVGLGVGFVFGVGIFVFSGQALITAGIPAYVAHWSVLVVMLAVAVMSSRQKTYRLTADPNVGAEALFALSIALIVLSMRHPWVFPFAIPVAIFEGYRHHTQHQVVLRLVTGTSVPVGWLAATALRPDRWWYFYQGNDSQYFEAIGWSIAQWGVFEHPGFVGGSIANYHWLSYAFFGAISQVALLGPWDALMKLGSPLLAFAFGATFVSRKKELPQLLTPRWLVLVLAVSVMPTIRVDSFAFSILVALGLFSVFDTHNIRGPNVSQALLFLLLAFTLIFSKISTAAVVVAIVMVGTTIQIIRKESTNGHFAWLLLGSFVISYFAIWNNNASKEIVATFSPNLESSLVALRSFLDEPFYVTQFFLWVIFILTFRKHSMRSHVFALPILIITSIALALHLLILNGLSVFFGLPGLFFVTFLTTRVLIETPQISEDGVSRKSSPLWGAFALLGLGSGFASKIVANRADSLFEAKSLVGGNLWEIIINTGYLFFIGLMLLIQILIIPKKKVRFIALSLVLVLGFNIGSGADSARRIKNYGTNNYTNRDGNSAPFPSQDLALLGKYVRHSTAKNEVLASNNFCCAGTNWWLEITTSNNYHSLLETSWGGGNYLLPAETQRRFLIQGLRFQLHVDKTDLLRQITRMDASLEFANSPNRQVASELKAYGVSGYVVNLSLTEHRDWSEFAIERFRSGNFLYLELR